MEEEARLILRRAVNGIRGPELLNLSERLFGEKHGVELEVYSRTDKRDMPYQSLIKAWLADDVKQRRHV